MYNYINNKKNMYNYLNNKNMYNYINNNTCTIVSTIKHVQLSQQ